MTIHAAASLGIPILAPLPYFTDLGWSVINPPSIAGGRAVGDGNADDTPGVQAILDSLIVGGRLGGKVYFPGNPDPNGAPRIYNIGHLRIPQFNSTFRSPVIHIQVMAGAVLQGFDSTPDRGMFDCETLTGQSGAIILEGPGIIDGANATSGGNLNAHGILLHSDRVTVDNIRIQRFSGCGIGFKWNQLAPPIECAIVKCNIFACGRGISTDPDRLIAFPAYNAATVYAIGDCVRYLGIDYFANQTGLLPAPNLGLPAWDTFRAASVSGLAIMYSTIEHNDKEGIVLREAGVVGAYDNVIENNGKVVTTAPHVRVEGSNNVTFTDTYIEDNVNQVHSAVIVEATAVEVGKFVWRGGQFGQYPVGSEGLSIGTVLGGVCRNVVVEDVFFIGGSSAATFGTNVQGYVWGPNQYSDNFNPMGGTGTRLTNNSIWDGIQNDLDRWTAQDPTNAFKVKGRLTTREGIDVGKTIRAGKTNADQASAGGSYDVGVFEGRVSGGSFVRFSILSTVGNTALLNIASGVSSAAITLGLVARHTTPDAQFGTMTNGRLDILCNGVIQGTFNTDGSINARLLVKVATLQVLGQRGAAVTTVSGTAGAAYTATEQGIINALVTAINAVIARMNIATGHGLIN